MEINDKNTNNPSPENQQVLPAAPPPQYYAPPRPPAKRTPVVFDKADSLFAALAVAIGFLFFECILLGGLGIGVVVFFVAAYAGIVLYGLKSKRLAIKKGAPLGVPIVLLLLCFVLFDNPVLAVLNLFFLFFLATLHVMSMFGERDHEKLSKGVVFDFFGGFVGRPFMNLDKLFIIAAKGTKDEKGKKGKRLFLRILLGVLMCVPLLAVILSLLASADFAFESVMKKITDLIGDKVWEYFGKFILGVLAAIPLFGALFAFRYKKKKGALQIPNISGNLDRVIVYTVMSIVCAVYLFFLFVQFDYMFSAFGGRLPGDFIYSEYARRGFFELVAIAAINLGLLLVSYLFTARREGKISKGLKTYLLVLSFVTVIIIASAVSKMGMYMQVYGLTQLRVYTSWFMVLTTVIFVLAIIKIISRKFNAVKVICVFFTAWFLVLNYAGVDALIATYNMAKSEQDKSVSLDVGIFESLSDSVLPQAIGLLGNSDVVARQNIKIILTARYDKLQEKNWQAMNVASMGAKKRLEAKKDEYYIIYDENRYGSPGTDKAMVTRYFPKITEIESCEWYYQPTFSPDFIIAESTGTVFYGYAVLSDEYFNEITREYEWTAQVDFLSEWYMAADYWADIPKNSDFVESQKYTDDQAGGSSPEMILNKSNKRLYFYMDR